MKRVHRYKRTGRMISALTALAVLFALFIPSFCSAGREALTVGVPTDRCPIFYVDRETGEIEGIGAELMKMAAERAGYDVTFKALGEESLKDALDNGDYDLVMPFGSAISSTSGQESIVSDNLFQTPFTLVTEEDEKPKSLNDLRIGMLRSLRGAVETVQQLYPGVTIRLYDNMDKCVTAMREGEVDALLHNSYVWSYILQKPLFSKLTMQTSAMITMDFRAGTVDTPESREIIERLNEGIAMISDTHRQAVILDYTTRRLYVYDFSDYLHEYGLVALLFVCLLITVILIVIERHQTMRLRQEEEMRRLIDQDPLTGALSLHGFRNRVEELLREHPDVPYVLVYGNIRNFKYINDSLGREAGDELLRFWVKLLKDSLREDEVVGRLNADRIAIFHHADGMDKLDWYDRTVINPVRNYFMDRGKEIRVQVCGGIYILTPEDYREINVDQMLDYGHLAEKRMRSIHGDGYGFYNQEQWEKGRRIAEVINHLPKAIESGDLKVWYQPQVDCATGEITGAEALCRWDHEKLGWLYPPAFIDTLEESGMIYDLDRFVWDRVCQDLKRWNEEGYHRSVSVNVSRRDLREDRDIPAHFKELTRKYGLTPDQIRIEITETAFVEKPEHLISTTKKLQEYGFEVEMDDFGSGHSSLHMLKEVPVDRIKLDLHFLTASGDPEKGRIIIRHMIQMVRDLGMRMITEGVETEEQAQFLRNKGCSEMQGYWFHKPMPVEDFEKLFTGQEK